jgi:hypothetical protein
METILLSLLVIIFMISVIIVIFSITILLNKPYPKDNPPYPKDNRYPLDNPVPKESHNIIRKTLQYVNDKLYCGINDNGENGQNQGPYWKGPINTICSPNGKQPFWMNGVSLETLAIYSRLTKDTSWVKIIDKVPDSLQVQLMDGGNGSWNDDRLWFVLAFLSIYDYGISINEPEMYKKELIWAINNFDDIHSKTFNKFTCNNRDKSYYTTWWQTKSNDTIGLNTYRNTITNSQLLVVGMRLYNIIGYDIKQQLYYYTICKDLGYFLKDLKMTNGLIADGLNKSSIMTNKDPSNCTLNEGTYTYTQGMAIYGFTLLSICAYNRNDEETYNEYNEIVFDLIKLMTLTPIENTNKNPLLKTVNNMSILTEYNNNHTNDSLVFKGIFMRYLSYALVAWEEFYTKFPSEATNKKNQIISQSRNFIRSNLMWVLKNYNSKTNNLFTTYWEMNNLELTKIPSELYTSGSTFSVIDLFNSSVSLEGLE